MPAVAQQRTEAKVYRLASVDASGRIRDQGIVRALAWEPGARLEIRERAGVIVVRRDLGGVFALTGQGHLLLPAPVRHWCGLKAGDRALLTADPGADLLVVYPPTALEDMVAQAQRAVLGGDDA
ncbi:AbrB/MazE/SpoVT family DNA-binding domain-containing protein [Micromonospora sp. NBC_01655]|uniref:AbrB/MazE/SpoVT family DNA-binding domain-containing protein n=1 Tax=Micromonospora sp. NBC_01655 TaxID=2975983 RepID=UPI00225846BA|nr:AbrB/MazE/SpoVT family DNA-binding domain-containing protein [Micromonospora sp. NBC_01655]MCX4471309.1 AbrB/MazE/SpoVT family DNA-binding domain-containing protein [Micromonospora sp. NBC_01655]